MYVYFPDEQTHQIIEQVRCDPKRAHCLHTHTKAVILLEHSIENISISSNTELGNGTVITIGISLLRHLEGEGDGQGTNTVKRCTVQNSKQNIRAPRTGAEREREGRSGWKWWSHKRNVYGKRIKLPAFTVGAQSTYNVHESISYYSYSLLSNPWSLREESLRERVPC